DRPHVVMSEVPVTWTNVLSDWVHANPALTVVAIAVILLLVASFALIVYRRVTRESAVRTRGVDPLTDPRLADARTDLARQFKSLQPTPVDLEDWIHQRQPQNPSMVDRIQNVIAEWRGRHAGLLRTLQAQDLHPLFRHALTEGLSLPDDPGKAG